ncbi:ABC transporter permease [Clostridioides difficile]|nr:ABC transporter permease [Clostridioides difficile]
MYSKYILLSKDRIWHWWNPTYDSTDIYDAFFLSSLAYSISLLLPNEIVYETIMTAIVLPIFFLSSALFPIESLSGGLKVAVMLNPFTHVINALRSLIFGETILIGDIMPVILLFLILCCSSFSLAMWRLKKEMVS